MKFYYNGKLMRTSKNHQYTHAVINSREELIGCRTSKDACQSLINSQMNYQNERIKNSEEHIKAIKEGKKIYRITEGRRKFYMHVDAADSIEEIEEWIEDCKAKRNYVQNNWKIVELEMREK